MLKHRISLERQINDRLYQFSVPYEAPLSEVAAIIEDLKSDIANRIASAEQQAKEQKEAEQQAKEQKEAEQQAKEQKESEMEKAS